MPQNRIRVSSTLVALLFAMLVVAGASPARAQSTDAAAAPAAPAPAPPVRDETEQNVITVPTTQPMRRFGSHFRITHRFVRDWHQGGLGELASDLFGLDEGAVIGLDYRFAPMTNVQAGVYRSMLNQTIQFSGRYDALQQGEARPLSLSALVSVEGTKNFRHDRAPAIGVVASRTYGRKLAVYASPTFVWHSGTPALGLTPPVSASDEHTAYVGLGTRILVPKKTFIVLEVTPRVSGFAPGRATWGAAVEKHTRGHLFQLNFSNSFGTTYGQLARGGERSNVYLGFNIARKF